MIDLNNPSSFKHLDPKNVFGSTELLLDQCSQIWKDAKSISFPDEYSKVKNIIICGMGGSAYGGHVALSAFKNDLPVPLIVDNDYHLPKFVDQNSLVVLTSYSGSTEETLSCASEAFEKNAKVTGLTSGGKLAELLKGNPSLIFDPKFNPSGQPRLGTGYIVLGTLAILNKIGFLKLPENDLQQSIEDLRTSQSKIKDEAKNLAQKLYDHIPVIFSGDFLEGNAHIMRNQFNETSKSFSTFSIFPELNHHLMEGLKNPKNKNLVVLILDSDLYSENIKERINLTKDVVSKNGVPYFEYKVIGDTKISQVLNSLSFGGYVTFYLAILYGQDPSLIPWVDYFKKKLA